MANWTRVTAYVCGWGRLSGPVRELLIETERIWSGYSLDVRELEQAIQDGVTMSEESACALGESLARVHGSDAGCRPILYYALTLAAKEGLSAFERERFSTLAQSMGVSDEGANDLIELYLEEVAFARRLRRLLGVATPGGGGGASS